MFSIKGRSRAIGWGGSLLALAMSFAAPAWAQVAADPEAAVPDEESEAIVVTGSRIERAGFEAPTPTTMIGETELRQGNRPSIAQILNDQPQFRATSTPTTTIGNTGSSSSSADLRGLGATRTLTLINGRRFAGSTDLNNIPISVIKRVDIVTGGASAAWGSGAVAGVVNIILDDALKGLTLGADTAITSRGDGFRYGFDGSYGTSFADGRGHVMIATEYLREKGVGGRNDGSRPNLDAALHTSGTQLLLARDVNFTNATPGGIIMSGALAGLTFNPDGTLSPFPYGTLTNATATVGGGGRSQYDYLYVSNPYERINLFGRASFELSPAATIWVDAGYTRMSSDYAFFPEVARATATSGGLAFSKDNPFLSQALRAQLASGPDIFRMGRFFDDIGPMGYMKYEYVRENIEVAAGVDGEIGGGWKYSAYYGHGELRNDQALKNQRIIPRFAEAIDAVANPTTGLPICRIALTDPTTACRPLNLFGTGNASAEAIAYAFGTGSGISTNKLDTAGASLRGDLFSTWAGPVSIAVGVDARWESVETTNDALSQASALAALNFSVLNGGFDVKEGFGEIVVPLLDVAGVADLKLNGAARYSDYSNSGGIWSWKVGGTARLFGDILLRGTHSRDIRSPSINELFATRITNGQNISDPFNGNAIVSIIRYGGGNANLVPEIAHTTTIGGSYSPSFAPGFNLSVDYYKIRIDDVIGSLSGQDIVTQCFKGNQALCASIVRDSSSTITTIFATFLNLASYKTRGIDFEASYVMPMDRLGDTLPGTLRFRALATYVDSLRINDGVNVYDRAGDVGESAFTTPKWRGTGSITYQSEDLGVDLRVRYVGGGNYNSQQAILNNQVKSRTYMDLGAQVKVEGFTLSATVNNVFDRDPPFVAYGSPIYDVLGRMFQMGVKVNF